MNAYHQRSGQVQLEAATQTWDMLYGKILMLSIIAIRYTLTKLTWIDCDIYSTSLSLSPLMSPIRRCILCIKAIMTYFKHVAIRIGPLIQSS
jgi:hypothetical protein